MHSVGTVEREVSKSGPKDTASQSTAKQEIERKFLVNRLPANLENFKKTEILQAYGFVTNRMEIRFRKQDGEFFETVKIGSGNYVRSELEIKLSEEQFGKFFETAKDAQIEKTRYKVPYDTNTILIDVYHGKLEGLRVAEIEFSSEESAKRFKKPEWLGEEITGHVAYKNSSLAIFGLPTYNLEEGVTELVKRIKKQQEFSGKPVIVLIAGSSASGKTSMVAKKVEEVFGENAKRISIDDYYKGIKYMQEEERRGNKLNFDMPQTVDLDLLSSHLQKLKSGEEIVKPIYNMPLGEPDRYETVKPHIVIIVEGLFALNQKVVGNGDINVFVETNRHGSIIRRILRDTQKERTSWGPTKIISYLPTVIEMDDEHIAPTRANADMIIKNLYEPRTEATRAGVEEVQLKFKTDLDREALRRLGAERIVGVPQSDYYQASDDKSLSETGQILRIRKEGSKTTLTYKGPPKPESLFSERSKFEVEIDPQTEEAIQSLYEKTVKIVRKDRTIYQLRGFVFAFDVDVTKIEEGKTTRIGDRFIEVRVAKEDMESARFNEFLKIIRVDPMKGIRESYSEM